MTAREVIARIHLLDSAARVVHQTGSHQKWRLHDGAALIVPVHLGDIPVGTLRSIERQGAVTFGPGWLRRLH